MSKTDVFLLNSSSVSRCRLQTIAVQSVALYLFFLQSSGIISTINRSSFESRWGIAATFRCTIEPEVKGLSEKFGAERSVRSSHCPTRGCLPTNAIRIIRFFRFFRGRRNFSCNGWPQEILCLLLRKPRESLRLGDGHYLKFTLDNLFEKRNGLIDFLTKTKRGFKKTDLKRAKERKPTRGQQN